jgi:hypothetical protein
VRHPRPAAGPIRVVPGKGADLYLGSGESGSYCSLLVLPRIPVTEAVEHGDRASETTVGAAV